MNVTRRSRNIENHGHGHDRSAYHPIISHSRRLVGSLPHKPPFYLPSNASMLGRRGMRMVRRQTFDQKPDSGAVESEPGARTLDLYKHQRYQSLSHDVPSTYVQACLLSTGVRISLRAFTLIIKYSHTVRVHVQYPSCFFTIITTKTF